MKRILFSALLILPLTMQAQFKTGKWESAGAGSGTFVTIGKLDWMQQDIYVPMADTSLRSLRSASIIPKNEIQRYLVSGWRLPTLGEVREMVAILNGNQNKTGGKTVDSAYLQKVLPFTLDGIYFPDLKRVAGKGYMDGYYTSTDTTMSADPAKPAVLNQVMIHVYRPASGKMNIEPTFSRQPMYGKIRLVRATRAKS